MPRLGCCLPRRHDGRVALTPCSDVSAAGWITAGDRPWHELVGFGPPGFPAYARLLYLPDPVHEGQRESDVEINGDAPSETELLRTVLEVLARHTRTPDDSYFCLWDGWGEDIEGGDGARVLDWRSGTVRQGPGIAPAFPPWVLNGPKVVAPNRAYFLFHGTLSDFGDWGAAEMWPGQPRLDMPDPAFIWPADHAWCVANDVDPHWAGIGADLSAIGELLADPRLDVVPADPREEQPWYR